MIQKSIRVLLAKGGLDGHERGLRVLALGLRDEGMEVLYMGLRQAPEVIVKTALEEGVDVVGLSSMTGQHNQHFVQVVELLKEKGMGEVLVIAGGIIPEEDRAYLKERGIKELFGPGTSISDIANFIRQNIKP